MNISENFQRPPDPPNRLSARFTTWAVLAVLAVDGYLIHSHKTEPEQPSLPPLTLELEQLFEPEPVAASQPAPAPAPRRPAQPLVEVSRHERAANKIGIPWLPSGVVAHQELIRQAAWECRISPKVPAVFMTLESGGAVTARSHKGAMGLMQLMPATADAYAARLGLGPGYDVYDPLTNLRLGSCFLADLYYKNHTRARSEADLIHMMAVGYHAGETNLEKYLRGQQPLSYDTRFYADHIVPMWLERHRPASPAYHHWVYRGR